MERFGYAWLRGCSDGRDHQLGLAKPDPRAVGKPAALRFGGVSLLEVGAQAPERAEEDRSVEIFGTIQWSQARCATGDATLLSLFFSEEQTEIAQAKQICRSCPLREACLDGALRRREPVGVWGGELFDRGRVIERKRPRGRPRKSELLPAAEQVA